MSWKNSYSLLTFVLLLSVWGCGKSGPNERRPLVTVDWVRDQLKADRSIQIIDVRPEEEFDAGHIPGVRNIWRSDIEDRSVRIQGMRIKRPDLEKLLSTRGIQSEDSVYLYDAKGNVDAARLWWLFQLYGFDRVALVDGGYVQWRMKGFPTTSGPETFGPSEFLFPEFDRPEILAVKKDIQDQEYEQLIDVRSKEEYDGYLLKNGSVRGGHIPGAIHMDYLNLIDGGAFTLKDATELKALFESNGIALNKKTISYCHSGVRSALMTFTLMEILQMPDASNYDGSWVEWSADDNCHVESTETGVNL